MSDGWKFTPLIFDDINNFDKYASDTKFSYFIIEGIDVKTTSSTGGYDETHYYLNLRLPEIGKRDKVSTTGFCRIELYPNFSTMMIGTGGSGKRGANRVIENLYQRGVFYNWSPILLKAQLEAVSSDLSNNMKPYFYGSVKDDNLSATLSKDTLYVPKSLLMSFSGFTGKEKSKDESVFEGYHYKYKVCSDAELFDIFQTQKRGRLLFEYVKSSTDKFVTIYDLKEKKTIYRDYIPMSYNLKSKDIDRIGD